MNYKTYRRLSRIARGLEKADVVLHGAHVLDVFNECWRTADVAIADEYIVGIGTYEGVETVNCTGKYIVPGFIDSHLHLESTLVNPQELVYEAMQFGTTAFVVDPHEAANVAGLKGIQYMLDATAQCEADVYVMAPSCVPAIAGEDNGAVLDAADLAKLLDNPRILGLGEVMDCPSVLDGEPGMMDKLALFAHRVKDGHSIGLSPVQVQAYALAGITTNHECVTYEEAKDQVANGMYVWIREGSAAHNLDAIVKGLVADGAPTARYGFCTDDKHIEDIQAQGHISYNVRRAIELGIPPIDAFKMASYNTAICYNLQRRGAVAPGYRADMVILDDERAQSIAGVWIQGKPVSECVRRPNVPAPVELLQTVNIGRFTEDKLQMIVNGPQAVITMVPGQIVTTKTVEELPTIDGVFTPNAVYNKITCIERYRASGRNGVAAVKGFNLHNGAIATSFAHDAHNVVVIGDNDADMMVAIDRMVRIGGGYVIASEGKVIAELPLEIMGLISNRPHEEVDAKVKAMKEIAYGMGISRAFDPFINLSFLALSVIPSLRITTKGLVEVGM